MGLVFTDSKVLTRVEFKRAGVFMDHDTEFNLLKAYPELYTWEGSLLRELEGLYNISIWLESPFTGVKKKYETQVQLLFPEETLEIQE